MPSWSRIFLRKETACISLPGGLVVSMRRHSCVQATARSEYCCKCEGGMRDEARSFDASVVVTTVGLGAKPVSAKQKRLPSTIPKRVTNSNVLLQSIFQRQVLISPVRT